MSPMCSTRDPQRRDQDGAGELLDFQADSFDVLDNASLEAAAKKLQAGCGFGYRDAIETWNTMREWRDD